MTFTSIDELFSLFKMNFLYRINLLFDKDNQDVLERLSIKTFFDRRNEYYKLSDSDFRLAKSYIITDILSASILISIIMIVLIITWWCTKTLIHNNCNTITISYIQMRRCRATHPGPIEGRHPVETVI